MSVLRDTVARLIVEANYNIPADILQALRDAAVREESPLGRRTLEQIVRNYEVAAAERLPVCQDSGLAVVLLDVGQDVHWIGGSLQEAIYEGIREGTKSGYLRWSVTGDPTRMLKTAGGDTPGVIHVDLVPGAEVKITVASKGFGAENMSALKMFVPADGVAAITELVLETVDRAGANACPPIIVGVGVGGTFETAALLAKKAVLRPIDVRHPRAGSSAARSRAPRSRQRARHRPAGARWQGDSARCEYRSVSDAHRRASCCSESGLPFHPADVHDHLTCQSFH